MDGRQTKSENALKDERRVFAIASLSWCKSWEIEWSELSIELTENVLFSVPVVQAHDT